MADPPKQKTLTQRLQKVPFWAWVVIAILLVGLWNTAFGDKTKDHDRDRAPVQPSVSVTSTR
ncbi:hypothetical protein [Streptomyces sp. NPDC003077]|uniref:hypothetical protein n=1 Tax=Streptomyces sp. NPDC003077 TaxID=3154443 RepID=UPI0033A40EBA